MVDRRHPSLSIVHQCWLLDISRSGLYYQPKGISEEDLNLMKLIDRQYLATPFYGARKMAAWLKIQVDAIPNKTRCHSRPVSAYGVNSSGNPVF